MSNLIKSVYFNFNQDGTRVIDSDSQVEQLLPNFFQQEEKVSVTDQFTDPGQFTDSGQLENLPVGFQSGMNILNMEEVRQEERAKVTQEVSKQTEQMISSARDEAEDILRLAKEEAETIRSQAYEEGKTQGISEGKLLAQQEIKKQQEEFLVEIEQRKKELQEQELALEPKFAEIMIALIEKITGVVCKDKKEVVIYLIHQTLHQLERVSQITLRVSKEDMLLVSSHRQELKDSVSQDVEFDIIEDDSLEGRQCIIETDNKIIDCSLDVQLQNLQDQIRMLTII